jgi:hypothetical protein
MARKTKKYTKTRSEEAECNVTPVVTNFLFFCIIVSHRCFSVCNVLMSRHDLTTYSYSITVNILVYGTHTNQLPVIPTVCLWQSPGMLVRGRSSSTSTSSAGSLGESERYVPSFSFSVLPLRSLIGASGHVTDGPDWSSTIAYNAQFSSPGIPKS